MSMKNALLLLAGVLIVLSSVSAPAMAGDVLWFLGHSGFDEGHDDVVALLQGAGATVDVNSDPTLPALTGYTLAFIVMPGFTNPADFFTAAEKTALSNWLQTASHRVVMVGDWDGFYQGQAVMNDLLAAIGNPIVFVPGAWDSGCGHCAGPLGDPDPLTAGLNHVCYALTPTWDPTYGKPLAFPESPGAPGPWLVTNNTLIPCIVGVGDSNALTDLCHPLAVSGDADSRTFATRLYTVTCAGEPQFACCLPDGACQNLTRTDCDAAYGTFHDGLNCDQVVCNPSPVENGTWGHLKSLYR
jgi:hypothetical protein